MSKKLLKSTFRKYVSTEDRIIYHEEALELAESDEKKYKQEVVGCIDKLLVDILKKKGLDIKSFDVDGTIWYLIPMSLFSIGKGERTKDCIKVASWQHEAVPFHLLDIQDTIAKDSWELEFYSDACMLTDAKGHRIHTKHSYEGHRSSAHWYIDGWRDISRVEESIRAYTHKLCDEQYED